MLKQLWLKFREALLSVLPVTLIVLFLSFTPLYSLTVKESIIFLVSALILSFGISLFNLGAELSMEPMGEKVGSSLMKSKKIGIILLVSFIMGSLITIAEPDLKVLASQCKNLFSSQSILMISVALGVGIFLLFAVAKVIFKKDLSMMLMFFYLTMFAFTSILIASGNGKFLPLSFDAGGVTTGPISAPFIMALGIGVASTIGGRDAKENSFGLIAHCSIGPILVVLLLGLLINKEDLFIAPDPSKYLITGDLGKVILSTLLSVSKDVIIALGLISIFFIIIQFIFIKLPKHKLLQLGIGILYTFLGLVLFLTAASIGFMPIGYKIGEILGKTNKAAFAILGFVLGVVVVLAEPAIKVLIKQVEEVTTGAISRKGMLIALSVGIGIAICLSMIRIIFNFSILYYIIPGYLIALGLMLFVPKLYTAIAFDSGGVACGPLTSSFILPLAIGACTVLQPSSILEDAFGIVAMIALTPLITIQLLGFKSIVRHKLEVKYKMKQIIDASDEQIIKFM